MRSRLSVKSAIDRSSMAASRFSDVQLGDVVVRLAWPSRCRTYSGTVGRDVRVPPAVRRDPNRLIAAGLDPDAVAATARMAVTEDLMGGIDVTSTATDPADHRSVATFGARAGRGRRAAGRSGGHRGRVRRLGERLRPPRRRRRAGRRWYRRRQGDGTDPAAAHRRTQRAEPAVSPLRDRDTHPPMGRALDGTGLASATPARRRPVCGPWRSTRCVAEAG